MGEQIVSTSLNPVIDRTDMGVRHFIYDINHFHHLIEIGGAPTITRTMINYRLTFSSRTAKISYLKNSIKVSDNSHGVTIWAR